MTLPLPVVATLTTEEVAAYLGASADTVRRMRRRGQGPRYIVLAGGSVRYLREDVEEWLDGGGNSKTNRYENAKNELKKEIEEIKRGENGNAG